MNDAFQFGFALPVDSLHGNRLVVVELLLWVSYLILVHFHALNE